MPWKRMLFKNGKVWAETDESGELVIERGLVRICYRENDDRTYSAKADALSDIDHEAYDALKEAKKKRKKAATKKRESSGEPKGPVGGFPSAKPCATVVTEDQVPDDAIIVYTDGACFANPGPMGAGVVLIWNDNRREISTFLGHGTNNLAELHAVRLALEAIKNPEMPVRIFSDSSYVIGLLARGWKAKENREVVDELRTLARGFSDLAFVKVKGHAGIELNERVDELAKLGAEKGR